MKIPDVKTLLLIYSLSSCSVNKPTPFQGISTSFCEPVLSLSYAYDGRFRPQTSLQVDSVLTGQFSQHDLLMANALGILPLLQEVSQLRHKTDLPTRVERVTTIQQIETRLSLASTEISSLAAELDCEGERADQLATYLDQRDQKRIRGLTLLSIATGAMTTVATALIQTDQSAKLTGIGGGLLSAGIGGAAALSSHKSIRYVHPRNLLADIWGQSENSEAYSPFIWYVLNEKLFSNSGQRSIRANIRHRWQGYVLDGSSAGQQALYFGPGGSYQADDLHKRAAMLNQLQSSIRSINQDLQSLRTRLVTVFG